MSGSAITKTMGVVACCAPLCVAAAQAPVWSYRVVQGDTLYDLAQTYLGPDGSWQKLQRFNHVADPRRLAPGRELRMPLAWLRAQATVATVDFLRGAARRETAGAAPATLATGDSLRPGDVLVTEPGASLTLRLADDSRVLVGGGARVRMASLLVFGATGATSSRLELEQGETDSRINPARAAGTRYDVRTPALTLGVRGTEFRVRVDAQRTTTEVTEGRVAAAPASAPPRGGPAVRAIDAGFGLVAAPAQAVGPVQALPPAPSLATLPTLYERVPLEFSWPAPAGAVAYRAQVFAEGDFNRRWLDGVFDRPAAQWADLPDGRYVLQVRARNAQGLEGLDGRLAFTLKARPEPPFTRAPRDEGHAYGERVEFRWTASAAAQRYRLQVATESRFQAPLVDRRDLDATDTTLALPPGRYHWRLASIAAGDDQGPFSDSASFELRETPPPPAVDTPESKGDTMVFRWRARPGDDAYDVQVAHDAAFTQLVLERRENLPELVLDTPPPGRYYLRVRSIQADGFVGAYGTPQEFKVSHSLWWWLAPGVVLLLLL
ncbi:MAG: FecR domain-containing protein [Rhizobacter sp.]|nr:FecR domain-containing protein [Rhizobacter sp.]